MTKDDFPDLDIQALVETRDALHGYARVMGGYTAACRLRRKHWWNLSLRPSLEGLTTGVIHAEIDFEMELNLRRGLLRARTHAGAELDEALRGQPASELARAIREFLSTSGLGHLSISEDVSRADAAAPGYSAEVAESMAGAWRAVSAAMEVFRAGVREETSPIQLWPHHFDLSMIWLPGEMIPGQNPDDEENADKQLNFGFTLGDAGIAEPYFYVTAYPLPRAMPAVQLPSGTTWHSEGFNGAVLPYRSLMQSTDPQGYLLDLWNRLLAAGREHITARAG
jgi:hypothetical protein